MVVDSMEVPGPGWVAWGCSRRTQRQGGDGVERYLWVLQLEGVLSPQFRLLGSREAVHKRVLEVVNHVDKVGALPP